MRAISIIAVALALVIAGRAHAEPDPISAFMAKYRDSIAASGGLLYAIGICEPYVPADKVTFYLAEYAAPGDGASTDFINARLGRMHLDLYLQGRRDRAAKALDGASCKRLVEGAAADLDAAQKRDGRPAKPVQR